MFLVVEEQDSKSWLKSVIAIYLESACHAHIQEIYNNQNTNEIIKRVQWNMSDPGHLSEWGDKNISGGGDLPWMMPCSL